MLAGTRSAADPDVVVVAQLCKNMQVVQPFDGSTLLARTMLGAAPSVSHGRPLPPVRQLSVAQPASDRLGQRSCENSIGSRKPSAERQMKTAVACRNSASIAVHRLR
jgi:hypothetical protein